MSKNQYLLFDCLSKSMSGEIISRNLTLLLKRRSEYSRFFRIVLLFKKRFYSVKLDDDTQAIVRANLMKKILLSESRFSRNSLFD
ncbi:MAG: hypothetical protein HQM10_18990 [Candidatus Riflebacteria bacterium]|nr:hypothetical protein [Candidatus Riflebacteria bacterium]